MPEPAALGRQIFQTGRAIRKRIRLEEQVHVFGREHFERHHGIRAARNLVGLIGIPVVPLRMRARRAGEHDDHPRFVQQQLQQVQRVGAEELTFVNEQQPAVDREEFDEQIFEFRHRPAAVVFARADAERIAEIDQHDELAALAEILAGGPPGIAAFHRGHFQFTAKLDREIIAQRGLARARGANDFHQALGREFVAAAAHGLGHGQERLDGAQLEVAHALIFQAQRRELGEQLLQVFHQTRAGLGGLDLVKIAPGALGIDGRQDFR